jgi:hypothetical protein
MEKRFICKSDFRLSGRNFRADEEFLWTRLALSNRTINILLRKGCIGPLVAAEEVEEAIEELEEPSVEAVFEDLLGEMDMEG